jgi:hypothetical protein
VCSSNKQCYILLYLRLLGDAGIGRGVKCQKCLYTGRASCLKLSDVFKSIPPTTPCVRMLVLLVLQ